MDLKQVLSLTKSKSASFLIRINPDLLRMFDEAIQGEYETRNAFFEEAIFLYLEKKARNQAIDQYQEKLLKEHPELKK